VVKKKRFFESEKGEQAAYKSKFQGRKTETIYCREGCSGSNQPPTSPEQDELEAHGKLILLPPISVKKPPTPTGLRLQQSQGIGLRKKKRTNDIGG
jgi:hypothetical protein